MKTTQVEEVRSAPGAATTLPAIRVAGTRPERVRLCLECAYAELWAEEPRARCACSDSIYAQHVVFAGQPGCAHMTLRDEKDRTLAWCSPGLKTGHARFVQPRPRAH